MTSTVLSPHRIQKVAPPLHHSVCLCHCVTLMSPNSPFETLKPVSVFTESTLFGTLDQEPRHSGPPFFLFTESIISIESKVHSEWYRDGDSYSCHLCSSVQFKSGHHSNASFKATLSKAVIYGHLDASCVQCRDAFNLHEEAAKPEPRAQ